MKGILTAYLAGDHDRLDNLLRRALRAPGEIDMEPFAEFRAGLMRHIAMEEKVMLPAVAAMQGGRQADVAAKLRLDHGALVALLVPPPTPSIIATMLSILGRHNELEEKDGGVYEQVDTLSGAEAEPLTRLFAERSTPTPAIGWGSPPPLERLVDLSAYSGDEILLLFRNVYVGEVAMNPLDFKGFAAAWQDVQVESPPAPGAAHSM